MTETKRILFAGYAPVHFLCFLPVYRQLTKDRRLEVYLSGGFKRGTKDNVSYSLAGFYDPFPVDQDRVISVEEAHNEEFDVVVCAHLSDKLFPPSVKRKVQIFHGVSFKNLAVREKALRYDFLCLPGRYHAELYEKSGLVVEGGPTCLVTGFPKADNLVADRTGRDAVLERYNMNKALPTILFAPTGEKRNALETMGEDVVRAFAACGAFNLLVKPHDHPKNDIDWFATLEPLENERVRVVKEKDVVPLLKTADLLITDASSVAVEYTLLDRPIIFLDVPKLFKRIQRRAPALDLTTYGRRIGTVVRDADDVVAAVEDCLQHPEREAEVRRAMARHVFHRPGRAAERVKGVVLHAAGLTPDLPADVELVRPVEGLSSTVVMDQH